ncbi:unnamed protein product [Boreogadus saida]
MCDFNGGRAVITPRGAPHTFRALEKIWIRHGFQQLPVALCDEGRSNAFTPRNNTDAKGPQGEQECGRQ